MINCAHASGATQRRQVVVPEKADYPAAGWVGRRDWRAAVSSSG